MSDEAVPPNPSEGMDRLTRDMDAFRQIHDALLPLEDDKTRIRVLRAAAILLGINLPTPETPGEPEP